MDTPGRPKLVKTTLELLNSPGIEPGVLHVLYTPIVGGLLGFVSVILANWAGKKPLMSGIQKHIVGLSAGVGIGVLVDKYRNEHLAKRDAIFRHYIELHPEDFPPYERVKIGDVFEPWRPIR
ncbi:hypothetical protein HUJ04_009699 [Dendroctonus ponderosae]